MTVWWEGSESGEGAGRAAARDEGDGEGDGEAGAADLPPQAGGGQVQPGGGGDGAEVYLPYIYRVRSMKEHLSWDRGTNIIYWANINLFALVNLVCLWGIKKYAFEKFRLKLILNQIYNELTKHSVEI